MACPTCTNAIRTYVSWVGHPRLLARRQRSVCRRLGRWRRGRPRHQRRNSHQGFCIPFSCFFFLSLGSRRRHPLPFVVQWTKHRSTTTFDVVAGINRGGYGDDAYHTNAWEHVHCNVEMQELNQTHVVDGTTHEPHQQAMSTLDTCGCGTKRTLHHVG